MSRSLDDYMKILRQRFDVMKKVVLDKKVHDQSVKQIRQNRIFPRNQTFAVGDLVYLYGPSAATLQTRSRKFKEDWIGPLQNNTILDKSHYLLADWQGKLLAIFGAEQIYRLKPCYLNLGKVKNKVLATVSNIPGLKDELEAFEPP